jgi:hypothetical protein
MEVIMRIDNFTAQDIINRKGMLRSTYKVEVTTEALCRDLLEARETQQDSIWKDAPEDSDTVQCTFIRKGSYLTKTYHRELPKSKEEVFFEKKAKSLAGVKFDEGCCIEILKNICKEYSKLNDPS